MQDFIEKSSKKLIRIYQGLLDNGFMDDSELELNINEILRDFYDVNKFLNISYIIFNNPNTNNEEKADLLYNFRDSYGNKLLTRTQSRDAVHKGASLVQFFRKLYKFRGDKMPTAREGTLTGGGKTAKPKKF